MQEPTTTLELEDDRHQCLRRREWLAERCGMTLMALIVTSALAGLLGPGPLSHRVESSVDSQLTIEHDSIQHYESPAELKVRFQNRIPKMHQFRLGLSRSFTDHVLIEGISPEPESSELDDDRIVYHFRTSNGSGSGTVVFRYKYQDFGAIRFVVDFDDESRVKISHFVFP